MENKARQDSDTLSFSYDQVLAKLDELKEEYIKEDFTEEQKKIILKARDEKPVVSWKRLREFFVEVGWPELHESRFQKCYRNMKKESDKNE